MKFSAVILAGGKSLRMGCDKAFLEFDGLTLLERQINTLTAAGAEDIMISGRPDVDYSRFGCRVLMDEFPEIGPLGGVHAALKNSRQPLTLVLAVDLPGISAPFVQDLLMDAMPEKGVIPRVDGSIEPLAAVYPRAALPLAERMISQNILFVRVFAAVCVQNGLGSYKDIPGDFAPLFKNLNAPADIDTITTL